MVAACRFESACVLHPENGYGGSLVSGLGVGGLLGLLLLLLGELLESGQGLGVEAGKADGLATGGGASGGGSGGGGSGGGGSGGGGSGGGGSGGAAEDGES